MKYALQWRSYSNEDWTFTDCPDDEREWDDPVEAEAALLRCVNEWPSLGHRLVRMKDGEPVMVATTYDPTRLWESA